MNAQALKAEVNAAREELGHAWDWLMAGEPSFAKSFSESALDRVSHFSGAIYTINSNIEHGMSAVNGLPRWHG